MAIYPGRRPKTWRVVVWSKGKPHEEIVEGLKKDAERIEAQMRIALEAGRSAAKRAVPSFIDFCEASYQPYAERHLAASTWKNVRMYQVATLVRFFGKTRMTDISTEQVERFKTARLGEVGRRAAGPPGINNELRVLRTILNWAAKVAHYAMPKVEIKKLTVKSTGRCRVWSLGELDRLFEATRADTPELLPVFVFLVNTGCRKGEAIAAEWDWVDLEAGMLRIPANEYWSPKSGLPREVPISDALRAALAGPRRNPRWLFPTIHGGRRADFPKDIYWRVRDAAGLKGGVHTLRHTFASHFLAAVPDMFLLAQVLGHSHQRVTEIYSHLLPEHLSRARNAVNIGPALKTMATTMAGGSGKA